MTDWAERVIADVWLWGDNQNECRRACVQALRDERERCAKVCKEVVLSADKPESYREQVAAAIRGEDET